MCCKIVSEILQLSATYTTSSQQPPTRPSYCIEQTQTESSLVVILDISMLLWWLGSSWVQSVPLLFSTVTKLIIKMSPIKYNTVGNSLQFSVCFTEKKTTFAFCTLHLSVTGEDGQWWEGFMRNRQ